jgi:hypothetical protein
MHFETNFLVHGGPDTWAETHLEKTCLVLAVKKDKNVHCLSLFLELSHELLMSSSEARNTISSIASLSIAVFFLLLRAELIPMVMRHVTEAEPPTRLVICVDGTWLDPDGLKGLLSLQRPAMGQSRV